MTNAPETDQEPAFTCVHCPRLLHADELDRWACRVCEDRAREHLRELRDWYPRLSDKLTPGAATGDSPGRITGSTSTNPLPVSIGALDLLAPGGVVTQLRSVEDDWRRELGWTITPFRGNDQQTLPGLLAFLNNNAGWACARYEDVAGDLKLIRILHGQVDVAVNGRKEPQVPVGCCPKISAEGVLCGERLKTTAFAMEIRCGGCGTRWGRNEWLRLGAAIRGFPMPVSAVA